MSAEPEPGIDSVFITRDAFLRRFIGAFYTARFGSNKPNTANTPKADCLTDTEVTYAG